MRWLILFVGLLVLAGCDNDRVVDRRNTTEDLGDFAQAFNEETSANDQFPELVNRRPVLPNRPAPPVVEEQASGPVIVAATGPTTRPVDPYTAQYNPASVITLRGPIVGFRRIALSHDRTGLFAEIHVGGEIPEVYLGPEGWLADQGLVPEIANRIVVTGSRLETQRGGMLIIARDVGWGDTTLAIRDANGQPNFPLPVDVDDDGVE